MSGSDGPSTAGLGYGSEPCRGLRFERVLEQPDPQALQSLQPGDRLVLALREDQAAFVAVLDQNGREIGAITPIGRLLECLAQGVPFVAVVRTVEGSVVWLDVQAAE